MSLGEGKRGRGRRRLLALSLAVILTKCMTEFR
jgi:hypothetical protein